MFRFVLLSVLLATPSVLSFNVHHNPAQISTLSSNMSNPSTTSLHSSLVEPSQRDKTYGTNIAKYLIDLHDTKSTFDFCGGMMFQLVLSENLRTYLESIQDNTNQPFIHDSSKQRMFQLQDYTQNGKADNVQIFHGRELRKVPNANGGRGFVLHLSLANGEDPEGWSKQEIDTYNGWEHDVNRTWRNADVYENEGFQDFKTKFGKDAFGLHHRFYLHYDSEDRMWLSAEDGCEGTPAKYNPLSQFFPKF
mmetsp:Transcript_18488/g.26028  ORF Transcript_18488/g.26028 Transcript_18488/m.26028 type:complete len:249 (-) Transcript_18488:366-1112(-)